MSDLNRAIIDSLNDLKQRVADLAAQDSIKFSASTGLPTFSSLTAGSVLFAGASGVLAQDNANLFWDDSGNSLGVGTVSPTAQFHAKRTDGNYQFKSESASRTYGWGTATTSWFLDDVTGGARRLTLDSSGVLYNSNAIRVEGYAAPAAGSGLELGFSAGSAFVTGFNRTGGVYLPLVLRGSTLSLQYSGTTGMILNASGNVGINSTGTANHKLHVADAAAAGLELESSNTTGYSRIRFVSNTRTWGLVTEGSAGASYPGKLAVYDYTAGVGRMVLDSSDTYLAGDSIVFVNNSGTTRWLINSSGHLMPTGAGSLNIGSAVAYVNEVNYKTLTDRGCLALIQEWEMRDGRRISNLQVLREMKPHAKDKTIYGEVKLDYASVPKHSHKPAPVAEEDVYEDVDGPEPGAKVKKLKHKKGEKMGEDGVEMTSIFSMMIGAIRELADENDALKVRLGKLEAKQTRAQQ